MKKNMKKNIVKHEKNMKKHLHFTSVKPRRRYNAEVGGFTIEFYDRDE